MKNIPRYDFYKHKYGDELLIDVVQLQDIKKYVQESPAHTLTYYDITLITDGEGEFRVDRQTYHVSPQDIIFTRPGEIREWDKDGIQQGFALIFEEEFLLSFFNDRNFIKNLSYFREGRSESKISLRNDTYNRIFKLISEIQQEIHDYRKNGKHLLRALLYETLIWLDRLYVLPACSNSKSQGSKNTHAERFTLLVEQSFKHEHSIKSYADQLCITPNHLNNVVKKATGVNAKQFIINKILIEAKRLLAYTDFPITVITEELGYETSSYFIRLFHSQTGMTPLEYRRNQNREK